ncbi:2-hydroxyacid dehydrogenase [Escherichia coli]|uniref:2-hydroxyacid dehydrogenase n=1 Tax=Escherichia coli TaxID=562 RepID=UPI001BEB6557|nr:glyoxylate/hydroxypyruvate reductase A [Escherichia coli]EJQ7660561.1 glyoxylate/hydroxypyruvate reductase A [Escherichia coli]EKN5779304.1 glyoxylate/hydroxypyruvate reductase A [Escherichia coli]ELR0590326.1 glyoxylate/hydroxypyruvate reductase A [Escherichia coli]
MKTEQTILYLYAPKELDQLLSLFRAALPDIEVVAWPQTIEYEKVRYVVGWNPPEGFFSRLTSLQAIFTLGAGVDRFLGRPDIPEHVRIIRLTDAGMAQQMLEYVLFGILRYQRSFDLYQLQQTRREWQPLQPTLRKDIRVSILGLGVIGSFVATALARFGYSVSGWSRGSKMLDGIACYHGLTELRTLLPHTDVLISMLPSTPETRGLLDYGNLGLLPVGAVLINVGRGDQVCQKSVLEMLESQHLRFVQLDVFEQEPLSHESPLWNRQDVFITPHVAAVTLYDPAVQQIADNVRILEHGGIPPGLVNRTRSY